jgi:hypothetical protein
MIVRNFPFSVILTLTLTDLATWAHVIGGLS